MGRFGEPIPNPTVQRRIQAVYPSLDHFPSAAIRIREYASPSGLGDRRKNISQLLLHSFHRPLLSSETKFQVSRVK